MLVAGNGVAVVARKSDSFVSANTARIDPQRSHLRRAHLMLTYITRSRNPSAERRVERRHGATVNTHLRAIRCAGAGAGEHQEPLAARRRRIATRT